MVVQSPSPATPDLDTEAGVIEDARARQRRRRLIGIVLLIAAVTAGALIAGLGGGGGAARDSHGQASGGAAGAGPAHAGGTNGFPGAPSTGRFYTGPGASCPLAHRSRYLPAWSGCVSTMVADVSGSGRPELVMTYSRLGHDGVGSPSRERYPAEQAMLRIVSPDGHVTTTPIDFMTTPFNRTPARVQKAEAAALISVSHVSDEPGGEIFLQTGQISSGSMALAYGLDHGRLVPSGVTLAYGGDSGTQAGFQCVAGDPPRLIQYTYALIRGIKAAPNTVHIYGWWNVTTTTYAWHGPRLVKIAQSTLKRRILPHDSVATGCLKGIA